MISELRGIAVPPSGDNGGMATVLVVEDESVVREVVVKYLRREGYRTLEAGDGDTACELVEREQPDLVVLDLMLPGKDGLGVCRWIRSRSQVPVIMLTARGEEADRIVGLELGADDYIVKPFSAREVVARIRAVLRRTGDRREEPSARDAIEIDDVRLDPASRIVTHAGTPVELARKEFDLLHLLMKNAGTVVRREQLIEEVWDTNWFGSTKTLDVHVAALRKKLGDDPSNPRYLHTARGVGFRFASPRDEA